MNKQLRTIFLIVVVIIIPILFYGYSQLLSLSDDEQMAEKIYERHLAAVLFSLNQYANDMMSDWARALSVKQSPVYKNAEELILSNESIRLLALTNMDTKEDTLFYGEYVDQDKLGKREVDQWFYKNDSLINKLTQYMDAGFQKIQSVGGSLNENLDSNERGVTFMLYDEDSVLFNAFILLDERYWTEGMLGGAMQKIATDNFGVAVLNGEDEKVLQVVYSTGDFQLSKSYVINKLWILPNMKLAIQASGENYVDLIRERSRNNLVLLVFTILILLIGIMVIIKNIRGALKIANLKSDFVANVSHEIRTPLALIRMYSETLLLNRIDTEDKKKQYYNVIFRESGRLTYLVNNILDFSRIEANKKTYQMERISLNEIVESVYEPYTYAMQEKQMQGYLQLSGQKIFIMADKQAVEEAISNVIDNAIKYNENSVEISVSTYLDQNFAYCEIKDTGIGIPSTEVGKVFEKFYRLEGSLTQKTKGTGLGLSLVKNIMEAHNGEVKLKTKMGNGSAFILKFPLETKK